MKLRDGSDLKSLNSVGFPDFLNRIDPTTSWSNLYLEIENLIV